MSDRTKITAAGQKLRKMIRAEMNRQGLTVYALCQLARKQAGAESITQTAIAEFLDGERSLNADYVAAILASLGAVLVVAAK